MKSSLTPVYPVPQFKLSKSDVPLRYVNVSNRMETLRNGKTGSTLVQIPAAMFTVLRTLKVPVASDVTMFLEDDGPRLIFGVVIDPDSEHAELIDLWHYTRDQVDVELFD